MFEREDWTLFRSLGTLGQKAGVPSHRIQALAIKELVDNALDADGAVDLSSPDQDLFVIDDSGPGILGGITDVFEAEALLCKLFSIKRPLLSTKLIRRPSRGALGNGLRVVAGAVFATSGSITVESNGFRFVLRPLPSGNTAISEPVTGSDKFSGTRISLYLPNRGEFDGDPLSMANVGISVAEVGTVYAGKTSSWWYDRSAFIELVQAAKGMSVKDLCRHFRVPAKAGVDRDCQSLSPDEAEALLIEMRNIEPCPAPKILGKLGKMDDSFAYAKEAALVDVGQRSVAKIPFVIEVYVEALDEGEDDRIKFMVNRTLITGQVVIQRYGQSKVGITGCGLRHMAKVGRTPVSIIVSVITPYMPITTDGKEPDFYPIIHPLFAAIQKGCKASSRKQSSKNGVTISQKALIQTWLNTAIGQASGDGLYRYSLRQLFYAVRPYLLDGVSKELDYNYFAQVITDIEAERGGDLPGLYRDARGIIYHPHTGEEIPLGTLNVESYKRPEWTFNKILYSEKEGFFSILKDAGWPEANDCALLTSKGFASRAARDVLDLIGESQEDIYFFCIHDADASGTLIYQALTEATRARGKRSVHVINLGLEPWEAVSMDLQVEKFRSEVKRELPVANYVDEPWREWLQTQRVELNAMSSPVFLRWLNNKFSKYTSKVLPPKAVLKASLEDASEKTLRAALARQILAENGFEDRVHALMVEIQSRIGGTDEELRSRVSKWLDTSPKDRWDRPIESIAREIVEGCL